MRDLRVLAIGLAIALVASGCAMQQRKWGTCAIAGGVVGGAIGGIVGGAVANNQPGPSNAKRGGAIGGGIVGGAAIGAALGHILCDPEIEPPPPPPPPPPPAPPAKGTPLGTVGEAFFDFDKSVIKPGGVPVLDKVVALMEEHPTLRVVVEGHTDSIGSDAYNDALSERRANAVRDYLMDQGIDGSRITTRGLGKSKPVATNDTEAGRAQNRRAEVIAD